MYAFIYLFVCLLACTFICLQLYLFVVSLFTHFFICLFVCLALISEVTCLICITTPECCCCCFFLHITVPYLTLCDTWATFSQGSDLFSSPSTMHISMLESHQGQRLYIFLSSWLFHCIFFLKGELYIFLHTDTEFCVI